MAAEDFIEKGNAVKELVEATELFERKPKFTTLEEIEAALQKGIYGA